MYNVLTAFHSACKAQSPLTRIRIYFISDSVDCTDDTDVADNGTLLKFAENDTDSNRRININSPVTFTEYYNPNENKEIGRCASSTLSMTLMNDDGGLNDFAYGRCKIYIDLFYDNDWVSVPMGVYIIDTPQKRKITRVSINAYDQMVLLDNSATEWWEALDFSGGMTYWGIVQAIAAQFGLSVSSASQSALCNNSHTFDSKPFASGDFTYRELLASICEANGCNASFNRDGKLHLSYYGSVSYGYAEADGIFTFDPCEYVCAPINGVSVKSENDDVGVLVGGDNAYMIVNNKFLNAAPDTATAEQFATNILSVIGASAYGYTPITFSAVGDWSLQAGDVIPVSFADIDYLLPIMQQTLAWQGGGVRATITARGTKTLPTVANAPIRKELSTSKMLHKLQVTADQLLSQINSIDGNYSEIAQTVNSITQTVGDLTSSVTNILDKDGEIWTFIKQTQSDLETLDDSTDSRFDQLSTYIRFTNEPAIILGVNSGDEIKLKLVNNVIYFFKGSDDSTDLSNAFLYINSEGVSADWITASNQVQIGNETQKNWMWHKIENGNLVLDLV